MAPGGKDESMVFRFCAVYSQATIFRHDPEFCQQNPPHLKSSRMESLIGSFDLYGPQLPYLLWKVLLSHTPCPQFSSWKELMRKISHRPWSQVGLSAAGGSQETCQLCDDRDTCGPGGRMKGCSGQRCLRSISAE